MEVGGVAEDEVDAESDRNGFGVKRVLEQGLDFASPEIAVGMGIRLDLPVGPIRFEYGHNLTRDEGEPSGTWHFAIGTAF